MRFNLAVVLILAGVAPLLSQETPSSRTVHVVVNDPSNRVVTGFSRQNFDVIEDGGMRPITAFSDATSPISVAIVAESVPAAVMGLSREGDQILQTESVTDALSALAASKNPRKALIFTSGSIAGEIPGGIHVLKTGPQSLAKAVIEVMNSYSISFSPSRPNAAVEVNLRSPAGMPPLTLTTR